MGLDELKNKEEMCSILDRIVDFDADVSSSSYEQLPAEMIEKISSYLDLEDFQRLALTSKTMYYYQSPYIKSELIKQKIVKQVQDIIKTRDPYYNSSFLLYNILTKNPNSQLEFLIELIKVIRSIGAEPSDLWNYLVQYNRTDVIRYFLIYQSDKLYSEDLRVLYLFYRNRYNNPEFLNLILKHPKLHPTLIY